MVRAAIAVLLGSLVLGLLGTAAYLKSASIPEESRYVGSASCERCHRSEHAAWAASQHTKMMRKPDAAGVVVANFDSPDAPFALAESISDEFTDPFRFEETFGTPFDIPVLSDPYPINYSFDRSLGGMGQR